jgi:beta-glucanase (GH16 family)
VIGVGIHPFGDPSLRDDFSRVPVAIDARDFHIYAADWTPGGVAFSVDGRAIAAVDQSPSYPMQLMLGIYEFAATDGDPPGSYPKEFVVDYVRGYAAG